MINTILYDEYFDQCDTILCLLEECYNNEELSELFKCGEGIAMRRETCIQVAPYVEYAYQEIMKTHLFHEPFDMEFIPVIASFLVKHKDVKLDKATELMDKFVKEYTKYLTNEQRNRDENND